MREAEVCRAYGARDCVCAFSQPLPAGLTCGAPLAVERLREMVEALPVVQLPKKGVC
jgi:hypothetical protein